MPPDYREIYAHHAERYDALVRAEDCDGNLLPALRRVAQLEGASVLEVGVGTGRLTRLLAPHVRALLGVEREPAMLQVARAQLAGQPHIRLQLGDAESTPLNIDLERGWADLALAGWVFGHFRSWMPADWREHIGRALLQLRAALRPGGTLVLIETLGTGAREAAPPTPELAEYYAWLEQEHGLSRSVLRTDYDFGSTQRAAELCGFFFGEALAQRITRENWTRVPEHTGLWSRSY